VRGKGKRHRQWLTLDITNTRLATHFKKIAKLLPLLEGLTSEVGGQVIIQQRHGQRGAAGAALRPMAELAQAGHKLSEPFGVAVYASEQEAQLRQARLAKTGQ